MKFIIPLLLSLSFSSYSLDDNATEALLKTLPEGEYVGKSALGNNCTVNVQKHPGQVLVILSSEEIVHQSEILESTPFRWNPRLRSFLASVLTATPTESREITLRTIAVSEDIQKVTITQALIDGRIVTEHVSECVILLKN